MKLHSFLPLQVSVFLLISIFSSCSGKSGSEPGVPVSMSSTLFGVNLSWERMSDNIMQNGDLLRDSSFRYFEDGDDATADVWSRIDDSDVPHTGVFTRVISELDPGYTPPAGSAVKTHIGYIRISQAPAKYTGVIQQLISDAEAGAEYTLTFSSSCTGSDTLISADLYNSSFDSIASGTRTSLSGVWTHHEITLTPSQAASSLGIYFTGPGEIKIDEVRLYKKGAMPSVKATVKTKIAETGIKSLRWPGGTLADWFEWKDSTGPLSSRGETATYNSYETPALGLHEFLNLCEELEIRPLIIVNVRAGAQNAADLVEYIMGPSSSVQGAVRAENGKAAPWNAPYFEIGNEPPAESEHDYGYDGSALENMGSDYADRSDKIITAMKAKASELGKTIFVGGISETAFQLPGWMSAASSSEIVRMIAKWNSQVFGGSLISKIDFTHGHFYSSRYYHTDNPGVTGSTFISETHYKYLMTGGEVLKRTIFEKIKPLTGSLPLWITEYNVLIEEENNPMPYFQYCMDYQSGLSIADMLMKMLESGVDNAYAWNLSQDGSFGLLGSTDGWYYRPAGLVFKMFSAVNGEEKLTVSHDNTEAFTIPTGYGNVPSGLSYDLISVFASKNKTTGKPRLFILNRDYSADKTITVTLDGYLPGSAKVYLYNHSDLLENNETAPHNAITVIESARSFGNPLLITVPAHSFMRIDF